MYTAISYMDHNSINTLTHAVLNSVHENHYILYLLINQRRYCNSTVMLVVYANLFQEYTSVNKVQKYSLRESVWDILLD